MIVCPRCSKENQDHYMFCLGCGTELKGSGGPKGGFKPSQKPPGAVPGTGTPAAAASTSAGGPAPQVARGSSGPAAFGGAAATPPAAAPVKPAQPDVLTCPRCSTQVPKSFRFCGSCGFDMTTMPAPEAAESAPDPTLQAVNDLPAGHARLVLIRPDGSEGDVVPLTDDFVVGRDAGGAFAGDSYLSPQHARIKRGATSYTVEDLGSLNGVFLRLERDVPQPLRDGSVFRIGQEIIRFEAIPPVKTGPNGEELMGSPDPGFLGRILLVVGRDTYGNAYPIPPDGMHLGRERGDIIFPDDGYVSGLHCRLHSVNGQVHITDVGSSNGSFIRITQLTPLRIGSLLLLGQQLFRLDG